MIYVYTTQLEVWTCVRENHCHRQYARVSVGVSVCFSVCVGVGVGGDFEWRLEGRALGF